MQPTAHDEKTETDSCNEGSRIYLMCVIRANAEEILFFPAQNLIYSMIVYYISVFKYICYITKMLNFTLAIMAALATSIV